MAVERLAKRPRLRLQPVEMLLQIDDSVLRIELHHFFEVALSRFGHGSTIAAGDDSDKPICARSLLV